MFVWSIVIYLQKSNINRLVFLHFTREILIFKSQLVYYSYTKKNFGFNSFDKNEDEEDEDDEDKSDELDGDKLEWW